MTVGYLILIYYVETAIFYLTYRLCYGKTYKRFWLPLAGGVLFLAFWTFIGNTNVALARVVVHGMVILTVFLSQKATFRNRMSSTIILFFIVNCAMELLLTVAEAIEKFTPLLDGVDKDAKSLIVYSVQLILFGVVVLLKEKLAKHTKKKLKAGARRSIIYGVIFMASAMLFTISGLQWARGQIQNPGFQILSIILCVSSYIGVGLLGLFSVHMEHTNKKLEQMRDNEKQIMDMQVRYYDTLLEREADTKKYRHDMSNHLICLEQLVRNKDISAVENYLGQMQKRMEEIQKRCFSTGNEILDILTNHYVNALDEETHVSVTGTIQIQTEPMKLCTIYANLLQNAVEELKRCADATSLEVSFKQGKEFFQIAIRNTLSAEGLKQGEDALLKTVKSDKENHGIGLNNVRKTVQELGGMIKLYKAGGFFCGEVTLKI